MCRYTPITKGTTKQIAITAAIHAMSTAAGLDNGCELRYCTIKTKIATDWTMNIPTRKTQEGTNHSNFAFRASLRVGTVWTRNYRIPSH